MTEHLFDPADSSSPVGGHGPHDDTPHWTVDDRDIVLIYNGASWLTAHVWLEAADLSSIHPQDDPEIEAAYAALVRDVQTARHTDQHPTDTDTLAAIKAELATYEDVLGDNYDMARFAAFVVDLLAGEPDG